MQKLITYLLLLFLLASCEEQSDWDLDTAADDYFVVDAIITNEIKFQRITLTKPVTTLNAKPAAVSGATILVSSNQLSYTFHEDMAQPGTYVSDKAFAGIRNRTYSLVVNHGTRVYTSKAVLEPPAEFIFLKYRQIEGNKYVITTVSNPYNPQRPAMYEIMLDWSAVPGFLDQNPDSCRATLYYYTLPTIDVSQVLAPTLEKVTFPKGTRIIERRYSLTDEHAAYFRALLLETTWSGGFFNTASANVPTNLSTGALGFFGACGVVEKQETVK
jgi:Domain of unknown function (DUF4249)